MPAFLFHFIRHSRVLTTRAVWRLSASFSGLRIGLLCSIVLFSGCSTLPPQTAQPIQYAHDIRTHDTRLANIFTQLKAEHHDLTGYHVLYEPLEALAARLHLIDAAEKTLDLQYYIWDNDKVGALALYGIIQAADRGVKVRLLLDDNNSKAMQPSLYALSQHPNIKVKLFNPHRFRQARFLDFVFDLPRMNRRMHNKTFMADNQVALIGGRNMSNQYYNASDNFQFSDVDVMLVGPVVDDIIHSFDEYWNHDYAYRVQDVVPANQVHLSYPSLKAQLTAHYAETTVQNYLNLTQHTLRFREWLYQKVNFEWVNAHVVHDSADKIRAKAKKEQHLNFQLLNGLNTPTHKIDLISAYFIPEKQGAERMKMLSENGIKVRVLTNSYQANDVGLVHAFYAKYRKDLLKSGIELYEFQPSIPSTLTKQEMKALFSGTKINVKGLSKSSLHTKLMALDDDQVFIGSFNFDPRSAYLNTEIGVILDSPRLSKLISQNMDERLPEYAYKLALNEHGKIIWKKRTEQGDDFIIEHEPYMKWWQKAGLKFISWLPLEGFM